MIIIIIIIITRLIIISLFHDAEDDISMGCHSLHHGSCFLLDRGKSYSTRQEMLKLHRTFFHSEFQPVAVESDGPPSNTTASFLEELGRNITDRWGWPVKTQFLLQRVNILI